MVISHVGNDRLDIDRCFPSQVETVAVGAWSLDLENWMGELAARRVPRTISWQIPTSVPFSELLPSPIILTGCDHPPSIGEQS